MIINILPKGAYEPRGVLRLITEGSTRPFSGHLEIYYDGAWEPVCNGGFSQTEANIACRQLGFVEALYSYE